ncbi:MAG: hypothetical protein V1789_02785 [PVC group bacterium]
MGLSIHYRGRLKSPDLISSITEELTDICRSLGWESGCLGEDFSRENTSRLVHTGKGARITGHLPLKGVGISPGQGCEGISFYFDRDGNLISPLMMAISGPVKGDLPWAAVKMQFAPLDIHLTIIELFRYLKKKYFEIFEVEDEGSYWETGDEMLLKKKMEFLAGKIDAFARMLSEAAAVAPGISPHALADKIEELLRDRWDEI